MMKSHVYDNNFEENPFIGVSERENSLIAGPSLSIAVECGPAFIYGKKGGGDIAVSCSRAARPETGTPLTLLLNGFYVWFSTPYRVAHLARLKEQSRKVLKGLLVVEQTRKSAQSSLLLKTEDIYLAIVKVGQWLCFPLFISKTLIKQFLLVLAMLNLVSSDLETLRVGIVTCVYDHRSDTR